MPFLFRIPEALAALALLLPGPILSQVHKTMSLKHGGIDRTYLLHVPAGIPDGKDGAEVSLCSIETNHVTYVNKPGLDIADMAWNFLSRFALDPSAPVRSRGRISETSDGGGWTGGPGQSAAGASPSGAWLFHGPESYGPGGSRVDGGTYFIDGKVFQP